MERMRPPDISPFTQDNKSLPDHCLVEKTSSSRYFASTVESLSQLVSTLSGEFRAAQIVVAAAAGATNFSVQSAPSIDPASPFELGCAATLLVSMLTHELASSGALHFDDLIEGYLPELYRQSVRLAGGIRIRHLLSHTSGFRSPELARGAAIRQIKWPELIERLREAPQLFVPGSVFSYSRVETLLLGEIIRRVSRQPVLKLIEERFFPLEFHSHGSLRSDASEPTDLWSDGATKLSVSMPFLASIMKAKFTDQPTLATAYSIPEVALPAYVRSSIRTEELPVSFGPGMAIFADGSFGVSGVGRSDTCGARYFGDRHTALALGVRAPIPHGRDHVFRCVIEALGLAQSTSELSAVEMAGCSTPPLPELEGTYIGTAPENLHLAMQGNLLLCRFGSGAPFAALGQNDAGCIAVQRGAMLPIALYRDPESGTPCVNLGMYAFRNNKQCGLSA